MKENKITIHKVIWYVIIFSIIGLLIETVYCYITTGILESRKGLILGPLCPIYGIGAVILIILLDSYKKSKMKLLLLGALFGSIFEYICSYVMQVMYGSRFWDYSYTTFQINGRISLTYTIFWGILCIVLLKYIVPFLDKYIDKIPDKLDKIIISFLVIDIFITIIGISVYVDRAKLNNLGKENENNFLDYVFNDKLMSFTFPNLRYVDSNGNEIFIKDIL